MQEKAKEADFLSRLLGVSCKSSVKISLTITYSHGTPSYPGGSIMCPAPTQRRGEQKLGRQL
jgi:hypothetical protein